MTAIRVTRRRPWPSKTRPTRRRGFSIVELLVSIAVVGVLAALLLWSIQFIRERGRFLVGAGNLRQIGIATRLYFDITRGWFPTADKTGNFSYRMAPGLRTPNDPDAIPEVYGLEALYVQRGLIGQASGIWVCPSQSDAQRAFQNTYAFSVASVLARRNPPDQKTTLFVWDNYTLYPGLSGFRGPFAGYTIPTSRRVAPHPQFQSGSVGYNALYLDGRVDFVGN